MEKKANKVQTTVRLEKEIDDALTDRVYQAKRIRRGASKDALINAALKAYLLQTASKTPEQRSASETKAHPHEHQEWIDRLLRVLGSGDADAIRAVQSNLVLFDTHVRMLERQRAERRQRPA